MEPKLQWVEGSRSIYREHLNGYDSRRQITTTYRALRKFILDYQSNFWKEVRCIMGIGNRLRTRKSKNLEELLKPKSMVSSFCTSRIDFPNEEKIFRLWSWETSGPFSVKSTFYNMCSSSGIPIGQENQRI
ncbi:hypothetical protein Syun_021439 [Stephania yunnanensis]|uniref:Uncharacterized protein n=1 Tax=Stephania yunnanensis TaxID=152371 RepID=A0AAP0IG06_9MAGN